MQFVGSNRGAGGSVPPGVPLSNTSATDC